MPKCGISQIIISLNNDDAIHCDNCKEVFLLTVKKISIKEMHEKMMKR